MAYIESNQTTERSPACDPNVEENIKNLLSQQYSRHFRQTEKDSILYYEHVTFSYRIDLLAPECPNHLPSQ